MEDRPTLRLAACLRFKESRDGSDGAIGSRDDNDIGVRRDGAGIGRSVPTANPPGQGARAGQSPAHHRNHAVPVPVKQTCQRRTDASRADNADPEFRLTAGH